MTVSYVARCDRLKRLLGVQVWPPSLELIVSLAVDTISIELPIRLGIMFRLWSDGLHRCGRASG